MATWKTLKRKYRWPLPCLWILAKQSMPTGVGSEFYTLRQNTDQHYMNAFPKKHLYALNSGWHVLPLDGLACTLWEKNLLTFQHISQIYLKCISISIWVWVLFGCFGFWGRGVGVVFFGGFVFCFFTVTDNSYFHWGLRQSFQLVNKKLHKQKKS